MDWKGEPFFIGLISLNPVKNRAAGSSFINSPERNISVVVQLYLLIAQSQT